MNEKEFCNALEEIGFKKCGRNVFNTADQYYKKISGTTHQVVIEHYHWELGRVNSCEISIRSSTRIGKHSWVDVKYYGMTNEDLLKNIDVYSDRLYKSLTILGGHPEEYDKYD